MNIPSLPTINNIKPDLIIQINNEQYPVNKELFSEYSLKFSSLITNYSQPILTLKLTKYSPTIFAKFINACQCQPISLLENEIEQFEEIASEWEALSIIQYISSYKKLYNPNIQDQINKLQSIIQSQQKQIEDLSKKLSVFNEHQDEFTSKTIVFNGKPLKGLFFWLRQNFPLDSFKTFNSDLNIPISNSSNSFSTVTNKKKYDINSIIQATSSTQSIFSSSPIQLLLSSTPCKWFTEDIPNQWLKFDFKDMIITISAYTFYMCESSNAWNIRSWKLEGSKDDISWQIIDEHRHNPVLNGTTNLCTWKCYPTGPFRYIKITQTGQNSGGTNLLSFASIEFFGTIQKRPLFFG